MKLLVLVLLLAAQGSDAVVRVRSNSTDAVKYTMAQHLMKSPVLMQMEYELSFQKLDVIVDKIVLGAVVGIGGSMWGCDRCLMRQFLLGTVKGLTCGGCCIWGCIDFVLLVFNLFMMAPDINVFGLKATFKKGTIANGCYTFLAVYVINMLIQAFSRPKHPSAEYSAGMRRNGMSSNAPSRTEIQAIFSKYDKDENGVLDTAELDEALAYLGIPQDQRASAINSADKNHDGKIDIEEFAEAFENGIFSKSDTNA